MSRPGSPRDAIVDTAVRLFRKQGYAATGLNQIVAESGAPKGSVYHYFPAGKHAIAAEAVARAGETVVNTLEQLERDTADPAAMLRAYARLIAGWMSASDFTDGSPIATVLLETAPAIEPVRAAGSAALGAWSAVYERGLVRHGVSAPRARRLAAAAIAAIEGGLLQARVARSSTPLLEITEEVAGLFEHAMSRPDGGFDPTA